VATTLSEQLAARLRAVLRSADHPTTASGTAVAWRVQRDRWVDALDPRGADVFDEDRVRELIDFLAESGPSSSSRRTPVEWTRLIDELTPELLFSVR